MLRFLLLLLGVGAVFASECTRLYGGECHYNCPSNFHYYSQGHCGSASQRCCHNHVVGQSTTAAVHHVTTAAHHSGQTECQREYGGECHSSSSGCPSHFHYYSLGHCGFLQQCCYNQYHGATTHSTNHVTAQPHGGSCGISAVNHQHRIVGGVAALAGEFPWMVSVRDPQGHMCGGTLIDRQYVLTAAHCFDGEPTNAGHWRVGMGSLDEHHLQIHSVAHITVHSGFNTHTFANDIALIKLASPVDVSGHNVGTACMPHAGENFADQTCTVSGWGATHEDGYATRYLRKTDLPVLSDNLCIYYLGRGADYTTKELCAGLEQGGKDSCQGDSGGPMVCQKDGVWKLAGVVSWGYGCAERRTPGIYTRVSEYLSWIASAKHN